jgi:hypothetical protein
VHGEHAPHLLAQRHYPRAGSRLGRHGHPSKPAILQSGSALTVFSN